MPGSGDRLLVVPRLAEQVDQRVPRERVLVRVVDGRRVARRPRDVGAQPVGGGDAVEQPEDGVLHQHAVRRAEGPDRGLEDRLVRDDVLLRAGGELPDGHHHGVVDVDTAGHQRLQGGDHLARDRDRVPRHVRRRPVSADTDHAYDELVRRSPERAGAGEPRAQRTPRRHHVQAVRRRHRAPGRLEQTLVDHRRGARGGLLGGLPHEHHVARPARHDARAAAGRHRRGTRRAGRGHRRASARRARRRSRGPSPRSLAARPCLRGAAPPDRSRRGRRPAAPPSPTSALLPA